MLCLLPRRGGGGAGADELDGGTFSLRALERDAVDGVRLTDVPVPAFDGLRRGGGGGMGDDFASVVVGGAGEGISEDVSVEGAALCGNGLDLRAGGGGGAAPAFVLGSAGFDGVDESSAAIGVDFTVDELLLAL